MDGPLLRERGRDRKEERKEGRKEGGEPKLASCLCDAAAMSCDLQPRPHWEMVVSHRSMFDRQLRRRIVNNQERAINRPTETEPKSPIKIDYITSDRRSVRGLPAAAMEGSERSDLDKHREVNSKFRAGSGMGESDGGVAVGRWPGRRAKGS